MKQNRGKYKATVRNIQKDTRPKAHAKFVRVSDLKARVLLEQIKNKDVNTAMAILTYSPRGAAVIVKDVLKSAIANAAENHHLDAEELYVEEAIANQGPTMKRIRPKAKGKAYPILKRSSHISIYLNEKSKKQQKQQKKKS
ncbi:MAG: 50S ribosomal protein L22 [Defluviitaleaceae bacterium]|nr:50S ribosomal protein L22 [Defluviitaleaceae bacterium]